VHGAFQRRSALDSGLRILRATTPASLPALAASPVACREVNEEVLRQSEDMAGDQPGKAISLYECALARARIRGEELNQVHVCLSRQSRVMTG
jgi:hypothetical protein